MGIKTAESLASQMSFSSFHSEVSAASSPRQARAADPAYKPSTPSLIDELQSSIVMLPVVLPTSGLALEHPQVPGMLRASKHLRHDSVSSHEPLSPGLMSKAKPQQHGLLRHISAGGDVRGVATYAGYLAASADLQVQAMTQAIAGGDPYMVKALLDQGVSADNAAKACATHAPQGSMQPILNLIGTRNPSRQAWVETLYRSATQSHMRPFTDLMAFLQPRRSELQGPHSIMHEAAQAGSFEVVCELLGHGISPFCTEAGRSSPFDLAVASNHRMIIKAFVENQQVRAKLSPKSLTAYLSAAVDNGALDVASVLMQAGAVANPAHVAVARKRFEDEMVTALEANIASQPTRTTLLQRVKSVRLRRQPTMISRLSWDDLLDGPPV